MIPKTFKLSKLQKFILVTALRTLRAAERRAGIKPAKPLEDDGLIVIAPKKESRLSGMRITSEFTADEGGQQALPAALNLARKQIYGIEIDLGSPPDPWDEDVSHLNYKDILEGYFGLRFEWKRSETLKKSASERFHRRVAYKAAMASVGRAVARLEKRGLIVRRARRALGRHEVIVQLTNEGIGTATSLTSAQAPK